MTRERTAVVARYSTARRLVLGSVRAGRRAAPMHGLLTIDVTDTRARLRALDTPGSFTAMVLVAVARAAAAHPEVHAYRDWRGRLVSHRYADVTVLVEVVTSSGPVAVAHLVRDADQRTVGDVTNELRCVRDGTRPPAASSSPWLRRLAAVPGAVPALYAMLGRSAAGRRRSGTVLVTAVGMFGGGSGFGIAPSGLHALAVVVGGVSTRPWVHDGAISARDLLDLTVTVDHRVVDGAPAARFAADLRRLLETGTVLDDLEVGARQPPTPTRIGSE
jgi:pyruvate/2-oxoglutarate dehydrogenase complex dihydrolipoamide acyltransferase (E2) component